jgi:hypothetical protein
VLLLVFVRALYLTFSPNRCWPRVRIDITPLPLPMRNVTPRPPCCISFQAAGVRKRTDQTRKGTARAIVHDAGRLFCRFRWAGGVLSRRLIAFSGDVRISGVALSSAEPPTLYGGCGIAIFDRLAVVHVDEGSNHLVNSRPDAGSRPAARDHRCSDGSEPSVSSRQLGLSCTLKSEPGFARCSGACRPLASARIKNAGTTTLGRELAGAQEIAGCSTNGF